MMSSLILVALLLVSGPLLTVTWASGEDDVGDEKNALEDVIEKVPVEELVDLICDCRVEEACAVTEVPRDCFDIQRSGKNESRIYDIYPVYADEAVQVYCDMKTDGGGWTVLQRREDGLTDFYRGWDEYKYGFGNTGAEFWLGNQNIYAITNQASYEIRVDLENFKGERKFAYYDHFRITDESAKYTLALGTYSGTAGDSFTHHAGHAFTTSDQDNDVWSGNCAVSYKGAWWYADCHHANLNGLYLPGESKATAARWVLFGGADSLKRTEMKIRPTRA